MPNPMDLPLQELAWATLHLQQRDDAAENARKQD
jgi:hypothetical protein